MAHTSKVCRPAATYLSSRRNIQAQALCVMILIASYERQWPQKSFTTRRNTAALIRWSIVSACNKKKEIAGTTLAPSSAAGFPLYGSLLRRNPSLSAVRLQIPRLGHAQRYLNARFRSFARHKHADNIPEERTVVSGSDLWFRGTRWKGKEGRKGGRDYWRSRNEDSNGIKIVIASRLQTPTRFRVAPNARITSCSNGANGPSCNIDILPYPPLTLPVHPLKTPSTQNKADVLYIKVTYRLFIMSRDSLLPMPLDCTLCNGFLLSLSLCLVGTSESVKIQCLFPFHAFFEATQ
ncbi:hypothetical protein G5I_00105 [Acromyrmex echinatior]|uniref:Uncharacterized protein n=1 Tax=Acromyrmex echinatior TaxID=103372 RepID=F4W401_ACREC|nr:hypothetical protein G5I_00105 [Acromyrmex echinatior]